MSGIIEWIKTYLPTILSCGCVAILFASLIVKVTPSTKDNEVLGKIIDVLDKFSIVKTADDKDAIEKAKNNIETQERECLVRKES